MSALLLLLASAVACLPAFQSARPVLLEQAGSRLVVVVCRDGVIPGMAIAPGRKCAYRGHFVLVRRKNSFPIMNHYPYTVGHLMAVLYRKVGELRDLGENEDFSLVVRAQELLRQVMKAQGFNIGINVGEFGGAGVPDHLHIHIVPRWSGDTNFMPMLSGIRVLSQGLHDLYQKLKAAQTGAEEAK